MNKNTLRAQALAIVMVVLVVASIIGVALFSRMAKDKRLAVEEQNSAAAAQAAEGLLDVLVGADIDDLESVIADDLITMPIQGFDGIKAFIGDELGLVDSATALPDETDWCPGAVTSEEETYINLTIARTEPEDFPEVQPGSVRAYNMVGATFTGNECFLKLRFQPKETDAVFVIKYVYMPGGSEPDTFAAYCGENDCTGITNVTDYTNIDPLQGPRNNSYIDYNEDGSENDEIDLYNEVENKGLMEIRILPIKGSWGISTEVVNSSGIESSSCISKQFNQVKVEADAVCQGAARPFQMILPGSGNLGYSTLFDYGIYDNGFFQP
jgi:type II secretory pathway pseudopilin PulG